MKLWLNLMAWVVGVGGTALGVVYMFFWDVWTVPGDDDRLSASILPLLFPGDVLVIARRSSVGRGNMVRCDDPQKPGSFVVARVMGLSGDRLEINGEIITIDGHRTPSPRACDPATMTVRDPTDDQDVLLASNVEEYGDRDFCALRALAYTESPTNAPVEHGKVYLVSDNRHIHLDSRDYGQIDPNTCHHILFRAVGSGGLADENTRFTIIW